MNEPTSPYLKRPLRSMDEAMDEVEATHGLEEVILDAIVKASVDGAGSSRQFQAAVDSVMAKCPELTEPLAVSVVHRVLSRHGP
ncbi:MAG: hypothetical protein MI920_37915 [Kiloniellales bacterium]|nr:hypothetical protein [Kiloniellales bacterium]